MHACSLAPLRFAHHPVSTPASGGTIMGMHRSAPCIRTGQHPASTQVSTLHRRDRDGHGRSLAVLMACPYKVRKSGMWNMHMGTHRRLHRWLHTCMRAGQYPLPCWSPKPPCCACGVRPHVRVCAHVCVRTQVIQNSPHMLDGVESQTGLSTARGTRPANAPVRCWEGQLAVHVGSPLLGYP